MPINNKHLEIYNPLLFEKINVDSPWIIFEEISKIEQDAFKNDALTATNLKLLAMSGMLYTCRIENEIVAEALVLKNFQNEGSGIIFSFAVKKEYRNKKIGSSLLNYIIQDICNYKIDKLFLTVDPANIAAIKLYKKYGFEELTYKSNFFGINSDRLIMIKKFSQ